MQLGSAMSCHCIGAATRQWHCVCFSWLLSGPCCCPWSNPRKSRGGHSRPQVHFSQQHMGTSSGYLQTFSLDDIVPYMRSCFQPALWASWMPQDGVHCCHMSHHMSLHILCAPPGSSSLLVSGGDDGMLHAWSVAELVSIAADTSTHDTSSSMAVDSQSAPPATITNVMKQQQGAQLPQPVPKVSIRIPSCPSQACWGLGSTGNGLPGITCAAAGHQDRHALVVGG